MIEFLFSTIEQKGFLLILVIRYLLFISYLCVGLLWYKRNPTYALNKTICLASSAFATENLAYGFIDNLAFLINPFPLFILNILRDVYAICLGATFVFFYISTLIIEYSWEFLKLKRKHIFFLLLGYVIFLILFIPNDSVLADGTIGFEPLGYIGWIYILILFILIYRRLIRVMRSVSENRNQAKVFLIGISMLLVGFIYFVIVNSMISNPPYVILHGDNFLYLSVGIIFLIVNLRKIRKIRPK